VSTFRIDLDDSKEDGTVLVKLSGWAQAETILNSLYKLKAPAEHDPACRVRIAETDPGAGVAGPRYRPDRGGLAESLAP
jgi:hypothetical protein